MDGVVISQGTLLIAGVVLFAVLMLVVLVAVVVLVLVFTRMGRVGRGEVFQAPADFLREDELTGLAGVFAEGGSRAHQAGMGEEGPPDPVSLKAAREYREAMKVVDRQVERATREVLAGKAPARRGGGAAAGPGFVGRPASGGGAGVKDE